MAGGGRQGAGALFYILEFLGFFSPRDATVFLASFTNPPRRITITILRSSFIHGAPSDLRQIAAIA